jgi:enoyl-CoA hydratase/carnithine racemase
MNSIPFLGHWEADSLFKWFNNEPSLRVAIMTGAGNKAFCAGQDLVELNSLSSGGSGGKANHSSTQRHPPTGFAGMSRRVGGKPIIAAVNGFALGGGFEICLNWYVFHSIKPRITQT